MEDITIRRMRIEELDEVQKLYAAQVSSDPDPLAKVRINDKQHAWEMRRIRQQWLTAQKYLPYVALGKDGIIGYAAALIEQQATLFEVEMVANIGELWIIPEYRNHGIGRRLVEELLHAIDDMGITWISVHMPCNDDLIKFMQKFGFKPSAMEMQLNLEDVPTEA